MRNSGIVFILISLGVFFAGCSKTAPDSGGGGDVPVKAGEISVAQNSFTIDEKGGTLTVSLKSTKDWWCTPSSWISVSPSQGKGSESAQQITLSVVENEQYLERTGTVKFSLRDDVKSVEVTVKQSPARPETVSVAEFFKKDVNTLAWYTINAVITSIESREYGDIYVKDDTGELFIYGLTKARSSGNDKSFSSLGLNEGDILTFCTVRSEYRDEPQAGSADAPAYYVSHKKGSPLPPVYSDFKADGSNAGWMELPAAEAKDGFVFLHHGMKIGSQKSRNNSTFFDKKNLTALWVAYPLTRKTMGYGSRTDTWDLDPLLSREEQPVIKSTYNHVEASREPEGGYFARGHQLPSADRLAYEANKKTFYGVNIAPQLACTEGTDGALDFNSGVWSDLENQIRVWAKDYETDTIYVVTGCLPGESSRYVLDNDDKRVTVPKAFYKALLRLSGGTYTGCAFYFEHKLYEKGTKFKDYVVTIDKLESMTGLDLFHNLPDDIENTVEAANPAGEPFWWD